MTNNRLRADFERHLPPDLAREVVDGVRYRSAAVDLWNDTRGIVLGGWAPSSRKLRQGTARTVMKKRSPTPGACPAFESTSWSTWP
jgi:hypothetical protein